MSLGLIKPGVRSANLSGMRHPKTGKFLEPIGYLKNGAAVWPAIGGAPDDEDPDDPTFTGQGGDDRDQEDDEDDEDDEEDEPKPKKRPTKKAKDDDDEDDEDEEEEKLTRPERQAARYRTQLRAQERENAELKSRLRALEDKDKKPDEVVSRDLTEAQNNVQELTKKNRDLTARLAFFTANTVDWIDPADAFALAEKEGLLDDVIDEGGNVDARELRRGLRELAKRKKHLVKQDSSPKARGRKESDDTDEDEEDDDEEPRSRQSANTMNRQRRGTKGKTPSRQELAQKFPVLNRI